MQVASTQRPQLPDGTLLGRGHPRSPGSGYDPWVEILQALAYLDYSPEDPAWWSVFHSSTLIRLGTAEAAVAAAAAAALCRRRTSACCWSGMGRREGLLLNGEGDSSPSGADSRGDGGSKAARWQDAVTEQIKLQLVSPTMSGSSSRSGGQEAVAANIPELLRTLSEAIARAFQPSASLMAAVQSSTARPWWCRGAAARVIASLGAAPRRIRPLKMLVLTEAPRRLWAGCMRSSSLGLGMGAKGFVPAGRGWRRRTSWPCAASRAAT
ncbi:MAG: hypothetical protein WDW36_000525 [Sanguina aurantia]